MKRPTLLLLSLVCVLFLATASVAQTPVELIAPELNVNPNEVIQVDITVRNYTDVASTQFAVLYDPAVLQYLSIDNLNLNSLSTTNFGTPPDIPAGRITIAWFDDQLAGNSIPDDEQIFTIVFQVIGENGTSSPIEFDEDPNSTTIIELTNSMSQLLPTIVSNGVVNVGTVSAQEAIATEDFLLAPITPNPIRDKAQTTIELHSSKEVQMQVVNAAGTVVFESRNLYSPGEHTIEFNRTHFQGVGSFVVRFSTDEVMATQRVIVVQ